METTNTFPTVPVLPIGNGNNDLISAIMSLKNGNKDNNFTDNPFIWLIFLALLGNGSFGFGGNNNAVANADIQRLEGLINNNHNNDLALSAINGNREAITSLASNLNCSVVSLSNAIDNVRNAMSSCCCCDIKGLVQSMGYETQLRDQANTTAITNNLCSISNAMNQGFSSIGYNQATQTATIVENANANTQRLMDTLNSHWTAELNEKLTEARMNNQTQTIINALKPTTTTGA